MLHIHRAERADALIEALGRLLADPLDDPFAPDLIAVPTRGMERWLTQRMSASLGATAGRSDGICANVEFPFPRRLAGDAVAAASGIDPESDPWSPQRAVSPLLEVVSECLEEPWLPSLAVHLGEQDDADRRARRFAASIASDGLGVSYSLRSAGAPSGNAAPATQLEPTGQEDPNVPRSSNVHGRHPGESDHAVAGS